MNIILVVLFILLLFIPLTFSDTVGGKTLAYENRMTATFPKIFNENGKLNTNLHIDFEAWINDNVALRPNAVKANIFLRYGIFNVSPQTDIYVGKDNWMFYTSVFCKRNFLTFAKIFPQAPVGKFYVNPSNFSSKISYV